MTELEGRPVLTERDMAKYPFVSKAAEYMKPLDIDINELASLDYDKVLNRAEKRIEEAILSNLVSREWLNDAVEISSFPIAVMMVAAAADFFLKKRYALAEAKRVSYLLKGERGDVVLKIARRFNWKIRSDKRNAGSLTFDFSLHFTDFLKNAKGIQDKKWKLINRLVSKGEVYLTKNETSRLLEEEVRRYIEKKLDTKVGPLPQSIMDRVERLKRLFMKKRGKIRFKNFPKELVIAAFPPCIGNLYNAVTAGHGISHIGRFSLTSFLISIGMSVEKVIGLYRPLSDFDERMTRYQVEHIAGGRGSRTRYIPPRCATLRTHGICPGGDEICKRIGHPLAYYRRKLRTARKEAKVEKV